MMNSGDGDIRIMVLRDQIWHQWMMWPKIYQQKHNKNSYIRIRKKRLYYVVLFAICTCKSHVTISANSLHRLRIIKWSVDQLWLNFITFSWRFFFTNVQDKKNQIWNDLWVLLHIQRCKLYLSVHRVTCCKHAWGYKQRQMRSDTKDGILVKASNILPINTNHQTPPI